MIHTLPPFAHSQFVALAKLILENNQGTLKRVHFISITMDKHDASSGEQLLQVLADPNFCHLEEIRLRYNPTWWTSEQCFDLLLVCLNHNKNTLKDVDLKKSDFSEVQKTQLETIQTEIK